MHNLYQFALSSVYYSSSQFIIMFHVIIYMQAFWLSGLVLVVIVCCVLKWRSPTNYKNPRKNICGLFNLVVHIEHKVYKTLPLRHWRLIPNFSIRCPAEPDDSFIHTTWRKPVISVIHLALVAHSTENWVSVMLKVLLDIGPSSHYHLTRRRYKALCAC